MTRQIPPPVVRPTQAHESQAKAEAEHRAQSTEHGNGSVRASGEKQAVPDCADASAGGNGGDEDEKEKGGR